jgi:hypothetical protein
MEQLFSSKGYSLIKKERLKDYFVAPTPKNLKQINNLEKI